MRRPVAFLLSSVVVAGLAWGPSAAVRAASTGTSPSAGPATRARVDGEQPLWVEMRNVDLHIDAKSAMHIRSLRGQVVPTRAGTIAWLDQPESFRIRATSGTVALDGAAITALLNEVAFNYPDAPLRKLQVTIENGSVVQRGILHKGVDIPFQMWSVPVLLPDGRLRLHPDRLKIFGVNGTTLMRALGLHLDRMMDLRGARGVSVQGDELFLEPLRIIPDPTVDGRLTSVRVDGAFLVQEFARTADDTIFITYAKPDSGARNFINFRGGQLRFGKLTMDDTDLLIHDADEADPLDLYFAEYNRQLVAGHTSNLENYGLRTWMVDYAKVAAAPKERTVASQTPLHP